MPTDQVALHSATFNVIKIVGKRVETTFGGVGGMVFN